MSRFHPPPGRSLRLGLATAALVAGALAASASLDPAEDAGASPPHAATLFESVALLRWGHGALGGLPPETTGDSDDRHDRTRRR